jgi:murein tripeptide amidase MpaA
MNPTAPTTADRPAPKPQFDRFYRHGELGALLDAYCAAWPTLAERRVLGRSHEGREIWLMVLTNRATGPDLDKPAFWADGNIHAAELTASTAVLYWLHQLLSGYGKDPATTHLLDTRAIYLVPRLNPDGAELALADKPRVIRSSTRLYPWEEETVEGLDVQDVDGDGRTLLMRVRDPHGGYKAHAGQPRLMVAREPGDLPEALGGGPYWRVLPEGLIKDEHGSFNGLTYNVNRDREGLDLNRNFPSLWRQEFEQVGAGPYPTSEPEVRAMVDFIVGHPNIGAAVSFHTHSGVILRPMGTEADDAMVPEDLWLFKRLSKLGEELTGYPSISIFHDFKYHPKEVITGTQDWVYEHLGALFWTVELWAPNREAGIEKYDWIHWYRDHPVDDDLKLLRWSDTQCGGQAHVDWYAFEHPQLGAVELGGWDRINFWRNPPPALREREVAKFPAWLGTLAASLPKLELLEARAERVDGGGARPASDAGPGTVDQASSHAAVEAAMPTWQLRIAVANSGYLGSAVSKRAVARKTVRGLVFELDLPAGAVLLQGLPRMTQGYVGGPHLAGHAPSNSLQAFLPGREVTADRAVCTWLIRAPAGSSLGWNVRADRAGAVRGQLTLGA